MLATTKTNLFKSKPASFLSSCMDRFCHADTFCLDWMRGMLHPVGGATIPSLSAILCLTVVDYKIAYIGVSEERLGS